MRLPSVGQLGSGKVGSAKPHRVVACVRMYLRTGAPHTNGEHAGALMVRTASCMYSTTRIKLWKAWNCTCGLWWSGGCTAGLAQGSCPPSYPQSLSYGLCTHSDSLTMSFCVQRPRLPVFLWPCRFKTRSVVPMFKFFVVM